MRVRDLAKTGEILDKSVTLGVNQGGGVSFANDDPSATITEARKKAVADAMAKAKTLTDAAGVRLGKIIEISEMSFAQPPMPITAKAFDGAAEAVPVAGRRECLQGAGQRHVRAELTAPASVSQSKSPGGRPPGLFVRPSWRDAISR